VGLLVSLFATHLIGTLCATSRGPMYASVVVYRARVARGRVPSGAACCPVDPIVALKASDAKQIKGVESLIVSNDSDPLIDLLRDASGSGCCRRRSRGDRRILRCTRLSVV
jgi:hypothetical protein